MGCGRGRLAPYFENYIGIDVSKDRIGFCRDRFPHKVFEWVDFDDPYPKSACYLFCNTLIHVPDDELESIAARIRGKIVIVEIMNPELRDGTCFARDWKDYRCFGEPVVFKLPYERKNEIYTFLVFDGNSIHS